MAKKQSANDYVRDYIFDNLVPKILSSSELTKVNLQRGFRDYLISQGVSELIATENAEKWLSNLQSHIEKAKSNWLRLGVPSPFDFSANGLLIISHYHPKWKDITGRNPLPAEFCGILEWIKSLDGKQFLFICAVFLKTIDSDPIYITDASGDGGIDLIGKSSSGPLRSQLFYIQSKTSQKRISRDALLLEYGKYSSTQNTLLFDEYEEALGIQNSLDGSTSTYLFISNNEFAHSAKEHASNLKILLRSGTQIAYWLSMQTNLSNLKGLLSVLTPSLKRDLKFNISPNLTL